MSRGNEWFSSLIVAEHFMSDERMRRAAIERLRKEVLPHLEDGDRLRFRYYRDGRYPGAVTVFCANFRSRIVHDFTNPAFKQAVPA